MMAAASQREAPLARRTAIRLACIAVSGYLAVSIGTARGQDEAKDGTEADKSESTARAPAETCFNISRALDISVISDQHVYVKTVGGNQYLLTLSKACSNLRRAYLSGSVSFPRLAGRTPSGRRDGVRIQPYGNEICPNDGSYLISTWFDRDTVCPIFEIDAVEDRSEAKAIADHGRVPVEVEEVTPTE